MPITVQAFAAGEANKITVKPTPVDQPPVGSTTLA
jgi:hypothetical protein